MECFDFQACLSATNAVHTIGNQVYSKKVISLLINSRSRSLTGNLATSGAWNDDNAPSQLSNFIFKPDLTTWIEELD
jgi:hypothetical protein